MATETSSREERRRKIVERGSDRLALITGQIQTLPSPSPSASLHLDSQIHSDEVNDSVASDLELEKQVVDETFDRDAIQKTQMQESRSENRREASLIKPVAQEEPNEARFLPKPEPSPYRPYYFSSKLINYCIVTSENIRFSCSVLVALLVVQSHTRFPLLNRKSIIAWGPLYIVLFTDVAIVLGLLVLEKQRCEKTRREEHSDDREERDVWGGAVKVLERGLVVHQSIRAIFIDSSVYVVIVVCGLTFM